MQSTALLLALAALLSLSAARAQPGQLFAQSSAAALDRQFGRSDLSWLLLDASGDVLAERWSDAGAAIAPGSLVKPFVAAAYGEQHAFVFPRVHCAGTRSRCWLPAGHGWLGLEDAITQSCNAYFLALAKDLDREKAMRTFVRLGLRGPMPDASDAALVGLGEGWKESPLALARAYLALLGDAREPSRARIARGMRGAAQTGTARELDATLGARDVLAKTGTAACSHRPHGAADGFALVLYPATAPRVLLLVRMHGATGAQTARVAGAMLRSIGVGED